MATLCAHAGAGVMGKIGKNLVGNLALSVHEFPHFYLKNTTMCTTRKLQKIVKWHNYNIKEHKFD